MHGAEKKIAVHSACQCTTVMAQTLLLAAKTKNIVLLGFLMCHEPLVWQKPNVDFFQVLSGTATNRLKQVLKKNFKTTPDNSRQLKTTQDNSRHLKTAQDYSRGTQDNLQKIEMNLGMDSINNPSSFNY